jgi:2,5-diketo-D-gluconate reductase A
MRTTTTPTVMLNNGVEMPILGFGVFQVPPEQTEQAVTDALAAGYRSLDTAAAYLNEKAVGRAIEASGIPREELFVTTKLWVQDQGEETARRAFETSLERLGLDYLDLYLIHHPFGRLLRLVARDGGAEPRGGHARNRRLELLSRPARRFDRAQRDHARGQPDRVPPVLPAQRRTGAHARARRPDRVVGPFAEGRNNLFTDPTLSEIGAAHGKSVAQVVLRWLIQRDVVVIPKSVRPERMGENFDVFDFELSDDEMRQVAALDVGASLFLDHRDPQVASQLGTVRIH